MLKTIAHAKGRIELGRANRPSKAAQIIKTLQTKEYKGSPSAWGTKFRRDKAQALTSLNEATPSRLVVRKLDGTIVHVEDRLK